KSLDRLERSSICPMPGNESRQSLICDRDIHPCFAGLVVIAGEFHPIPFRTRPLKPPAPMVLRLKTRESRSPPGLPNTESYPPSHNKKAPRIRAGLFCFGAGEQRPRRVSFASLLPP